MPGVFNSIRLLQAPSHLFKVKMTKEVVVGAQMCHPGLVAASHSTQHFRHPAIRFWGLKLRGLRGRMMQEERISIEARQTIAERYPRCPGITKVQPEEMHRRFDKSEICR